MYGLSLGLRLAGFFAVATLPIGLLTALFVGLQPALAVFIVGWLLLTPGSAILFGVTPSGMPDEMDELIQEEMKQSIQEARAEKDDTETSTDPVEELRQRYARGELGDREFEEKLEAILEMESLDPDDRTRVERTLETFNSEDTSTTRSEGTGTDAEHSTGEPDSLSHSDREPEYE
jgi:hypothetical protein